MRKLFFIFISYFIFTNVVHSQDKFFQPDDLFHIDHMDSHNKKFSLYFKVREKLFLRVVGFEPTATAWKAVNLAINRYPRLIFLIGY